MGMVKQNGYREGGPKILFRERSAVHMTLEVEAKAEEASAGEWVEIRQ